MSSVSQPARPSQHGVKIYFYAKHREDDKTQEKQQKS